MPSFIHKNQIDDDKRAPHRERWRSEIRKSLQIPGTHRVQAKIQLKRIEEGQVYTGQSNSSPGAISNKTKKYASCCRLKK